MGKEEYRTVQVIDTPPNVITEIKKSIESKLNRCGLFYRLFARPKTSQSVLDKIDKKGYTTDGKKLQDLIGFRIVLYFKDDINLCVSIIRQDFNVLDEVRDPEEEDSFKPIRLNIVCKLPQNLVSQFESAIWEYPIDQTFEIQIRTIFSEGWHEVEHDLRYKNQVEWVGHDDLSRSLNGIYATLETCDWAIINLFQSKAYMHYKNKEWEAMLRNQLRIRFDHKQLGSEIITILNSKPETAKNLFRVDRQFLLQILSDDGKLPLPLTMDNVLFVINGFFMKDDDLLCMTPDYIKRWLKQSSGTPQT